MGKNLNITQILNEVQEEKVVINSHPYWGLKCNRGLWLTRFPLKTMPEDPDFMMAFIRAGGKLDAMDHYGHMPEKIRELEQKGWTHEEIILFAKYVPEHLCQVKGLDEHNYGVYDLGLKRAEALNQMKINFGCSVWTLGSKPLKWFIKKLFSKGFRVSFCKPYENTVIINYYVWYRGQAVYHDKYGDPYTVKEALLCEGEIGYDLGFFPKAFLQYCKKCIKAKNIIYNSQESQPFVFSSLLAAKTFVAKATVFPWSDFMNTPKREKFSLRGVSTTAGHIFQVHKKLLVSIVMKEEDRYRYSIATEESKGEKSRKTYSVREVGGFSVCKIEGTWFVWSGNDFSRHIEGTGDLRSVIQMAERRRKKDSLILTLNDVRNDMSGTAGFCLPGTKNFLEHRMPHVYRLIKRYDNWKDIPDEIMNTEWALASRDIFAGYSSPVR